MVVIDESKKFIADGTATVIKVPIFLYDFQQPTQKLSNPDSFKIPEALDIKWDLVINRNAKIAIRKRTKRVAKQKKKNKKTSRLNQPITYWGLLRRRKCFRNFKKDRN